MRDEYVRPLPEDFFMTKETNGLKVNISAIVGMNGDGKSTLIELAMRLINNCAKHYKLTDKDSLLRIEGIKAELYYQIDDEVFVIRETDNDDYTSLAKYADKELFELIERSAPVLSKDLRKDGGYAYSGRWQKTEGKKGFDSSVSRLQELCYVITSNFVFSVDKRGNRRGWGASEYSTPEKYYGEAFTEHVYEKSPEESYHRLLTALISLFPDVPVERLKRFLK